MNEKIISIESNMPHKFSEVICVKCCKRCKHRWIAVRPCDCKLKNLECLQCHKQGYVIETGETMEEEAEE